MNHIERQEILDIFSNAIRNIVDVCEDLPIITYTRLIGALLGQYNAILRSDRMDAIEKEIKDLRELVNA